jgi:hypothetical protein
MWKSVMEFKYESMWGGWCSNVVIGSFRVGLGGGRGNSLDLLDLR